MSNGKPLDEKNYTDIRVLEAKLNLLLMTNGLEFLGLMATIITIILRS